MLKTPLANLTNANSSNFASRARFRRILNINRIVHKMSVQPLEHACEMQSLYFIYKMDK